MEFGAIRNNLIYITNLLLAELKVPVVPSSVATYVEAHPVYPGLLTISNCLSTFSVPNHICQIDKKGYWQVELPCPFVTHSFKDKAVFVLVREIDDFNLSLTKDKNKPVMMTKQEFMHTWDGSMLVAEPDEDSGEPSFYGHYLQSLLQLGTFPLLVLIYFSLVIFIYFSLGQHITLLFPLILSYLLPVLCWFVLKPMLIKVAYLPSLKDQLNKFRYNTALFDAALRSQPHYQIKNELKPIQLGNPDAENVLTFICNPFCQRCAQVHHFITQWLTNREDLKIQIILLVSNHAQQKRVGQHMLALGATKDQALIVKALNNWYQDAEQDYESWSRQYPVAIPRTVKLAFIKQFRWSENAGINSTPTLLFNGYLVPAVYEIEDLNYLICSSQTEGNNSAITLL